MNLLFFALTMCLLPVTVLAQPASDHTCRILFLDGPVDAPGKLQLFDGAKCREVELPRMNFSMVYRLPAGPLNLRLLPAVIEDPAKIPPGAPAVTVPETMADFFLLVTSDASNTVAPVRMQVIDATGDRLKSGQMLWFNLTPNAVGGAVGAQKLVIKPNSRVTLDPPAGGNQDYPVDLVFRMPGSETHYPLCETKWRHDPRSRSVVFICPEKGVRSPRVMVFPDYRDPEALKPGNP